MCYKVQVLYNPSDSELETILNMQETVSTLITIIPGADSLWLIWHVDDTKPT